jgi:hypothetical protein
MFPCDESAGRFVLMQRLFSIFPTGAAGVALIILRFSAAAALVVYGTQHPFFATSLTFLALTIPAGALCLGFLTPLTAGIGCVVEVAAILRSADQTAFPIILSILNTAATGMLGPGAYSLDARRFGRRVVRFSNRTKSDPP